ncbi:hypothetical protein [Gracilimonas tropica]|uniref:hypothetical protein n=1 Tax=Gracilimonas tropica TaxID=454600 RepID=UPI00037CBEAF|nr:hypothetical protein [Gracilimonas tropica]
MTIIFTVIAICFLYSGHSFAQGKNKSLDATEAESKFQDFSKGSKILSGNVYFYRQKNYIGTGQNNYRKDIAMFLGLDMDYLRLINEDWGIGTKAFFEGFIAKEFRSVRLIYIGLGPIVRRYIWKKDRIRTYAQVNTLLGYDMELGEYYGGYGGSGFRYRLGLRAGASYRLSNAAGVFLNIGPDWEGDDAGFDTWGVDFEFGIQLFRF